MQKLRQQWVSGRLLAMALVTFGCLAPQISKADQEIEPSWFHVAMNLGGVELPTFGLSLIDDVTLGRLQGGAGNNFVSQTPSLPDSLHFAGLAGTLNLVIDKSTGSPVVQGIELAPREILRFVADDSGSLRGLHGRISIRLDF